MSRFKFVLLTAAIWLVAGASAQTPTSPGAVQAKPGDACSGVRCPPGQRCIVRGDQPYCAAAADGAVASACDANPCPAGMRCSPMGQGGFCCHVAGPDSDHSTGPGAADPCAGIRCPEGQRCVAAGGRSHCAPAPERPNPCSTMRCPAGQRCAIGASGAARCVEVPPRSN